MASSSSSASPRISSRPWKHSVFLSFSGEDVRGTFISHLYESLCEISSDVFIDYRLKPAEEIQPELMKAIEESRIAVIVFSKSYASSTWCLEELEKIIECNKTPDRLDVIPVFYYVDSRHVHDPTIKGGIYAGDFARHFDNNFDEAQRWKDAMIKAAKFKGWDSQAKDISSDALLKRKVVEHVLQTLVRLSPMNLEGLVGIDSRIEKTKELLSLESNDVRFLGICGMGGIGKSTLTKALFNQIRFQFEKSCMLENIRQELEKCGVGHLREELLRQILGEKNTRPNIDHTDHLLRDTLSRKKVLIVLDDLTSVQQLNDLIGDARRFCVGSRIIVTSRNKGMVGKKGILGKRVHVIDPYEVKRLTYSDSFKLFSENAFEKKECTGDFWELSKSFIRYCRGVPLALKVLGRYLLGPDKGSWEIKLKNLENGPDTDIQRVLEVSFDDLCQDGQEMFLDVACVLCGDDFDVVKRIFECRDYSVNINDLIDKCLLTKSGEQVKMHPLLQEMGRKVERRKSNLCPSKRKRLWEHKDVCKVFKRKIVCESIESISLDMSKIEELQLDPHAFVRMPNLRFLRFHNSQEILGHNKVHLPAGLESLPDELLYLYWHGYPLKFLPKNFKPEDLVLLELPYSSLEQLWDFNKELSITCLSQLCHINLSFSKDFKTFPSLFHLKFLERLCLNGCRQLLEFPEVPKKIKFLSLCWTRIKEVPLWVEGLDNLELLCLYGCSKLKNVPLNIFIGKPTSYSVVLNDCLKLDQFTFSETSGCSHDDDLIRFSVRSLELGNTKFKILPHRFKQLCGIKGLVMTSCKHLQALPNLQQAVNSVTADDCLSLEDVASLKQLLGVENTDLIASLNFSFSNCLKVHENSWSNLIPDMILRIQKMAKKAKEYHSMVEPYFRILYPGSKIPEEANKGISSAITELPSSCYTSNFLGFTLFAVVKQRFYDVDNAYPIRIHCKCEFQNNKGESRTIMCCSAIWRGNLLWSAHVALWYDYNLYVEMDKLREWFGTSGSYKVSFKFYSKRGNSRKEVVVQKCGVLPVYDQDEEREGGEATPSMSKNPADELGSKYRRAKWDYCNHRGSKHCLYEDDHQEDSSEWESGSGSSESDMNIDQEEDENDVCASGSDNSDWDEEDENDVGASGSDNSEWDAQEEEENE